jgi:hypothetical protein
MQSKKLRVGLITSLTSLLALSLVWQSCANDQATQEQALPAVTNIPIELSPELTYALSEVLQITRAIPLESSPAAMLSFVSPVYPLSEGRWLTVDKNSAQIKVFDRAGQHLYNIGAVGKGPGEWLSLKDVDYDAQTGRLMMFSAKDMRINLYRPDGTWVTDSRLPFYAFGVAMISDGTWAVLTGFNVDDRSGPYHLLVADETFDITARYLPFDHTEPKSPIVGAGFLRRQGEGFLTQIQMGDTVFYWQEGHLTPRYRMDFGDRAVPIEKRGDRSFMFSNQMLDAAMQTDPAWETDEHLVFRVAWDRRTRVRVWDRATQRLWGYEQCDAPLAAETLFNPIGLTDEGEWIVALLPRKWNPTWYDEPDSRPAKAAAQTRDYLQTHYPAIFAQLQDMTEEDNYVLLCVKFALTQEEND